MKKIILLALLMFTPHFALAQAKKNATPPPAKKIEVVSTLNVINALVKEIGGDLVKSTALSSAADDPHAVKAKPSFKLLVKNADLFFQIGRSLELWADQVINSSGNSALATAGKISVSSGAKSLEVPSVLSRSQGDIHPQGNPHLWLSPSAAIKMADNIKDALIKKDPAHKDQYALRFQVFKKKLAEALFGDDLVKSSGNVDFLLRLHDGKTLDSYLKSRKKSVGGWLKTAQQIDYSFFTYHSVFSYLADDFSLKIAGQIEENSGVAPSARYRAALVSRANAQKIERIVAASYYKGYTSLISGIARDISGQFAFVDVDCRENESYFALIDRILKTMVALKPKQLVIPAKKIAVPKKTP